MTLPCIGKQAWPNRGDAARVAVCINKRARKAQHGMRAYQCEECGQWHLQSCQGPSRPMRRTG
jgi:hypothetical protein